MHTQTGLPMFWVLTSQSPAMTGALFHLSESSCPSDLQSRSSLVQIHKYGLSRIILQSIRNRSDALNEIVLFSCPNATYSLINIQALKSQMVQVGDNTDLGQKISKSANGMKQID